jgi:hypothetical protein
VGGIGRVVTVVCRKAGAYLIYTADRHGFHNPPDAWPAKGGRTYILAIGDSFAQGQCVPDSQGVISRLRETRSSDGFPRRRPRRAAADAGRPAQVRRYLAPARGALALL